MLNVLVSGKLVKPPKSGVSAKGTPWTSVSIRCPVHSQREEEEADVLANAIAFGESAEKLARLGAGDAVAVNGDARMNHWTDKDGVARTGLSVTVSEVISAYTARKKRGEPQNQANQSGVVSKNSTWGMTGKSPQEAQEDGFDDAVSF